MPTPQPWYRSALLRLHTAFWTLTRYTLLVWGVMNGLGVNLVGEVKRRISRRIPRISGSLPL